MTCAIGLRLIKSTQSPLHVIFQALLSEGIKQFYLITIPLSQKLLFRGLRFCRLHFNRGLIGASGYVNILFFFVFP